MTINNIDLVTHLCALALMCAEKGTDNCDLIITTSKGKLNCHIEFEEVEDENDKKTKSSDEP